MHTLIMSVKLFHLSSMTLPREEEYYYSNLDYSLFCNSFASLISSFPKRWKFCKFPLDPDAADSLIITSASFFRLSGLYLKRK